jgi:glycosyltransferase involved in cell wall biosynthesis
MKLFFIHEVSYTDKVIFEMHEFPEILASRSHDVYFYDFPERSTKLNAFNSNKSRQISGRVILESKLQLITPRTISYGIFQRLSVLPFSFFHLHSKLRSIRPDVIVTYAVPTYGLQILLLAKFMKIPIVYRAIDVSHLIRQSGLNRLVKILEGLVIRKSDFISCNNTAMRDYVISRGANPEKVVTNYPPIDFVRFRNNQEVEELNLKNLFFLGTLFPFTGLEEFIVTADRCQLFKEGYTLTIVGPGEKFESLKSLVEFLNLDGKIHFTGMIPYADLSQRLKEAGITLNPFIKSKLTDIALPHKVIQYAAAERPIVSTSLDGLVGLFDTDETIFWTSTPEEMIKRIRDINKMPLGELKLRVDRQTKSLKSKLELSVVIESFELVLNTAKENALT